MKTTTSFTKKEINNCESNLTMCQVLANEAEDAIVMLKTKKRITKQDKLNLMYLIHILAKHSIDIKGNIE